MYAFVTTPLLVRGLGQERYGVWSFLNGLTGYSSLLYLGVGSALIRQIAAYSATADVPAISRLSSVAITIFAALGAVTFAAFAGLSPWLPGLLSVDLGPTTAQDASIACVLLGVQAFLYFVTSGYFSALLGHDRFDLANAAQIGSTVVRFTLVISTLHGDRPLLRLGLMMTATALSEFLLVRFMAHRLVPNLRIRPAQPTGAELRLLYGFGVPAFFMATSTRLISYTDTTVIGMTLGATSVGLYSLPLQLIEYTRTAVSGYAGVLIARLSVHHAKGDTDAMRTAYLQSSRITALLTAFALANVVWLGVPFLELWAGPGMGVPVRWVLVWLALAGFLGVTVTLVTTPFCHAMQLLHRPAMILMGEALANLALSLTLARQLGITGVAFGTFVPALASAVLLPREVYEKLSLSSLDIVRAALLPAAVMAVLVSATQWAVAVWLVPTGYGTLVLAGLASLPAAAIVAALFSTPEERANAATLARRLRRSRD